jgi:16S rRNA (uracil1498-N3)-methyltransferase
MHRFYVDSYVLTDGNFHHAINVLRLSEGDEIEIIQGLGKRFTARIDSIDRSNSTANLNVLERIEKNTEPPCKLILIQCMTRPDKLSSIIETSTQMGVSQIQLAISSRSYHGLKGDRLKRKLGHLNRIAHSSSSLAGRELIPVVTHPISFEEAVNGSAGQRIVPWELETESWMSQHVKASQEPVTILIGPEGGLEHGEIDIAVKTGFKAVTLGPRILRAELASTVALAQILSIIEAQ